MKSFPNRGSEWRKWDLHVHTPDSLENRYVGEDKWERFILDLEALPPEIKVIGINDYLFIDGYIKVLEYKSKGRLSNIELILPVLEFRISKFAGNTHMKRINFHVIFSNKLDPATIQGQFLNALSSNYKLTSDCIEKGIEWNAVITKESLADLGRKIKETVPAERLHEFGSDIKEGFNNLNLNADDIHTLLQENTYLKNHYLTAIGKTEWDAFSWNDNSIAEKKDVINSVDIVFTAAESIEAYKKAKAKLIAENVNSRLLDCSDAHYNIDSKEKDRLGNCFTWIKANTTFEGLKQIKYEPEERVCILDTKPDEKDEKLTIDEVQFKVENNIFPPTPIKFNKNLNVIIGGKSSGKSILLFCIAKALLIDRSLLKKMVEGEISEEYKYDFGDNFDFTVKISSGIKQSINRLDDEPSILPEIKYIPQNHLSKLAEPDENKKGNELRKLIRGLLLEDRVYDEAYKLFIKTVKNNDTIRESIIDYYFECKDNLDALKKDLISIGDKSVLETNIKVNADKIEKLKEGEGLTEEQNKQYDSLTIELENVETEIDKLRADYTKTASLNTEIINALSAINTRKNTTLNTLGSKIKETIKEKYVILNEALLSIQEYATQISLDEEKHFIIENEFKKYSSELLSQKKQLLDSLSPFLKNQEIKKQINDLEKIIAEDRQKLNAIIKLNIEIGAKQEELNQAKQKLFQLYINNFKEYRKIIKQLDERAKLLMSNNLQIIGTPRFNFSKFRKFMEAISDKRSRSFSKYGIFDTKLTATSDYKSKDLSSDLKSLFSSIAEKEDYVFISGTTPKQAIKVLLDDYFFDCWDVKYDNDMLGRMSAGKASFVILMLIVELSKSKAPILIDQPEDNLDNRSISKDLVRYLKEKKVERQIILVTHNSNVVVNSDAENIIVANQKGQNDFESSSPYQFDYVNGALEYTKNRDENEKDLLISMGIREHIIDIVEGGDVAFKKREKKYNFPK